MRRLITRSLSAGRSSAWRIWSGPEPRGGADPLCLPVSFISFMKRVVCATRKTAGDVEAAHAVTEACLAVAVSHARGGAWVDLPMVGDDREMYVYHV